MNFDDLSVVRQVWIEDLSMCSRDIRLGLSELLVVADSWQVFRQNAFVFLDELVVMCDRAKKGLMRV